jgi:hypothetical protein
MRVKKLFRELRLHEVFISGLKEQALLEAVVHELSHIYFIIGRVEAIDYNRLQWMIAKTNFDIQDQNEILSTAATWKVLDHFEAISRENISYMRRSLESNVDVASAWDKAILLTETEEVFKATKAIIDFLEKET